MMAAERHIVVNADPFVKSMLSMIQSDTGQMKNSKTTLYTRSEKENGKVKHLISSFDCQKGWEPNVEHLVSSQIWLQNNGLKKKQLTLHQILPSIGFRFSEKLDEGLEKPVSSRYGRQLFSQLMRPDGKTFNISCSKDKLYHLEKKLLQAIFLFKQRIEWLTTESRRTFGVVEEKSVIIVLNFCNVTTQQFNQYMTALESVLRQQISQISTFNIIRACEDMQLFSPDSVSVSHETIESAVKWIWSLDPLAAFSQTSTVEAVLRALSDKHTGAVYLFTEGTSVNDGKEILKHKVNEFLHTKNSIPVHLVSFNCDCPNTIRFLRELAESTNGRFHAYAVVMDLDAYETQSGDGKTNRANIILKRKTLGGVPPGAGVRKDVVLIFEEMEEARSILEQLHLLRERLPAFSVPIKAEETNPAQDSTVKEEHYVTSREWLKSNGLDAKGLRWHEIVSNLAFRHTDAVVDLMHPSPTESQTNAIVKQKLVNARYCDELFPVVKLKDGQVFHVLVTPDIYRSYEEKVQGVVHRIQQRIDWLKAGSRALFGTLVEEHIYIIIDTSASMENSLGFVKQKIQVLMQEQLRYKKKFNIIAFSSKAVAWKDRLVDVSEHSLRAAWAWVQRLSCSGSTNTHAAIDLAMGDPQTEAIYLLTDGRPDQPPSTIIYLVKMRKMISVHTISFNCNDTEANTFLYDLAKVTGGRYHCFSQSGHPIDQPQAWESMDIKELKDEISHGLELLDELARLRDESSRLAWKKGTADLRLRIKTSREAEKCTCGSVTESTTRTKSKKQCLVHSLSPRSPSTALSNLSRRTTARHILSSHVEQHSSDQVSGSKDSRSQLVKSWQEQNPGSLSYLGFNRGRYYHTKTSSGRFTPNEWMLPETKALFQKQAEKRRAGSVKHSSTSLLRSQVIEWNKPSMTSSVTESVAIADQNSEKGKPLSTKQWLAKHGLAAKHLTITDALGSTFVSHKPKYVSVLDKYISGKVFNEIMPVAFVSGDQQMYFFNPNGINLKEYENRVRAAMDKLRKKLNTSVWEALPVSSRKEFDSTEPVPFESNQEKLLQLLREADWPVAETDVHLLLDEIAKGEKYINQSKMLRRAAASGKTQNDSKEKTSASYSSSEGSHRSRSNSSVRSRSRSSSSMSSRHNSQRSGENSPRRSRSRSLSSHSDHSDPEKVSLPSQEISSLQTKSRSSSRSSSRSHPSPRSQSKSLRQTTASTLQVNLSKRSTSRSRSDNSNKLLTIHRGRAMKTEITSARVENNLRKQSKGVSYSSGDHQPEMLSNASSSSSALKSFKSQKVSSNTNDNIQNSAKPLSAREKPQPSKQKYNMIVRRRSQKNVHKQISVSQIAEKVQNSFRKGKGKVQVKLRPMTGQKVIAKMEEDGLYYPGEVVRCPDPQHCVVQFDCNGRDILTKHVLLQGGAVSCPPLYVGDYVLIKVIRLDKMCECFVPAAIIAVPQKHADDKLYTVIMYSGQKARTKRRCLIKISQEKFYADCIGISQHQNENRDQSQVAAPHQGSERSHTKRPDDRKKHTRPVYSPGRNDHNTPSRSRSSSPESLTSVENTSSAAYRPDVQKDSARERSSSRDMSSPSLRDPTRSRSQSSDDTNARKDVVQSGLHKKDSSSDKNILSQEQDDTEERKLKIQKKRNKSLKKKKIKRAKERHQDTNISASETDDDPVPSRDKDTHLSWLHEQRTSLQKREPLLKGEHVLARWTDDGWYYEGVVMHYYGNCSYEIQDSCGYTERIWRENILQKHKKAHQDLEINQHVIALHPQHKSSYAPGIIEEINGDNIQVKCYNNQVISTSRQEVYLISYKKYKLDVEYIKKKEHDLVHSVVIARCDKMGIYLSGTVLEKDRDGQSYIIQWVDGSSSPQQCIHIFSAFSRLPKIQLHSRVLACSDPVILKFLPGTVTECMDRTYSVKFCDGTRQDNIPRDQCFWLEETYYSEAVQFCNQHKLT